MPCSQMGLSRTDTKLFLIFSLEWERRLYQPRHVCLVLQANKLSVLDICCFFLSSTQFSSDNFHPFYNHTLIFPLGKYLFSVLNSYNLYRIDPYVQIRSEMSILLRYMALNSWEEQACVIGKEKSRLLSAWRCWGLPQGKNPLNVEANPDKGCANYGKIAPWHHCFNSESSCVKRKNYQWTLQLLKTATLPFLFFLRQDEVFLSHAAHNVDQNTL